MVNANIWLKAYASLKKSRGERVFESTSWQEQGRYTEPRILLQYVGRVFPGIAPRVVVNEKSFV